ncbi:MAG: FAD-dependent thymidylate synthase [Euryarchaeota archaeon]|nr:FAD-dependent thymidylate synthase [Euryarchaeota archaeon]
MEEADFEYFVPKELEKNEEAKREYTALMKEISGVYRKLRQMGVTRESTRYVLPLATYTNYIWTVNARSLINFLGLRLCTRASPEFRELARMVHREVVKLYPEIFRDLGCRGKNWAVCPENRVRDSPQGRGCPYKKKGSRNFIPTKDDVRAKKDW